MRIYAVADIHGNKKKISTIKSIISQKKPDILVIAGDITNYFAPLKIFKMLKDITIPILCIRGNSDFKYVEKISHNQNNTTFLGNTPVIHQNRQFLGLNGAILLPFLSKICLREIKCFEYIKNTITPATILVVHPPPRGVCDKVGNKFNAGSFQLRKFIEKHPPSIVLCGHIHEQAGYQMLNKTLVVNCAMNKMYKGAIIDTIIDNKNNKPLKVTMVEDDII